MINARNKVYSTANFAMIEAYWNIGKKIIEKQGGKDKAEYGLGLIKELSTQMTKDFGKGFTVTNLKYMRQFYLTFPNGYALRGELSWTHYCRQINSFFYERLLSSQICLSKIKVLVYKTI